jgi:hypothetical protein
MVDVTNRLNVSVVGRRRQVEHGRHFSYLVRAGDVLVDVRMASADSLEIQQRVEDLESDWIKVCVNPSESEMVETVVSTLFEEIRRSLVAQQEQSARKLQREMNMTRFFQPDTAKVKRRENERRPNEPLDTETEILLATYQSDLDQVVAVRRKLNETSALLTVLSSRAVEQDEKAVNILDVAQESIGHIDSAESQLKKAIGHNSGFKWILLCYLWTLTTIVWILHFLI